MKEVYILTGVIMYEGTEILGVFNTLEDAQNIRNKKESDYYKEEFYDPIYTYMGIEKYKVE